MTCTLILTDLADFDKKKLEPSGPWSARWHHVATSTTRFTWSFLLAGFEPDAESFDYCRNTDHNLTPFKKEFRKAERESGFGSGMVRDIRVIIVSEKQSRTTPNTETFLIDDNKSNIREWNGWVSGTFQKNWYSAYKLQKKRFDVLSYKVCTIPEVGRRP